jgi:hypothetical protein
MKYMSFIETDFTLYFGLVIVSSWNKEHNLIDPKGVDDDDV